MARVIYIYLTYTTEQLRALFKGPAVAVLGFELTIF